MRGCRGSKFAEYLATYAILKHIGIHDTVLIEKRDASLGYGVYVRDACDSGTAMFVVPSICACSTSTMRQLGAGIRFAGGSDSPRLRELDRGTLSRLLGFESLQWAGLAWRLAIEQQRSFSRWWGWLNILPSSEDFRLLEDEASRFCRLHRATLLPYLMSARDAVHREMCEVYEVLAEKNLAPSSQYFRWALDIVLSRAQRLPVCCSAGGGGPIELGIMPFVDLVNGHDGTERKRNARVEIAFDVDELPHWYRDAFLQESVRRGLDGEQELQRFVEDNFFAVVVLERSLFAAEEVIMEYDFTPFAAGGLSSSDEFILGRLIRYHF
ncbi:hypothetical protein ERJ75_000710600 [Trypanosoma vivax]|uniref:SET domain-containing protein n=1 Tax=Trypanosoma vivax (strain Y486) TaxID=1055687 RepID=G0TTX0_TRYVY|nr:hypothetical protein TRVL_02099 [Trypanosoma vivax]KAH8613622.1 hypothetical protein ERJ75_000710600 [Trypanosoma vivax]CCC47403.1 conserved hypothetical protein [Trypanosoma vivax Y486]